MPYALATVGDQLLAGLADGRVLTSSNDGDDRRDTGIRVGSIVSIATSD
jgi:hypothetical protein